MRTIITKAFAIMAACMVMPPGLALAGGYSERALAPAGSTAKEGEAMVSLSWSVITPEDVRLDYVYLYSVEDPTIRVGVDPQTVGKSYNVLPGQYFICLIGHDYKHTDDMAYIYVSPVLDVTESAYFELDMNECVNHVSLVTYLPNGEKLTPLEYGEDGEILDYGNVADKAYMDMSILRKDSPLQVCNIMRRMLLTPDGPMGAGFNVNDLPEGMDVAVCTYGTYDSNKTFYSLVSFSADEIQGETVMESNPSGYVMFDAEYGSIQDETIQTGKTGYSWLIQAMHGGLIHDGFGFMWNAYDASPAFGISISGTEKSETEFLFNHGRMMGESYNATLGGTAYCRIISLPFTLSDGKLRYHGHLSEEHLSNTMLMAPQGGVDFFLRKNLVSHPRFSYDVEPESGTVTGLLGNNVPVLVTGTVWMPRLSGFSGMDLFYYGRYGEYRECDLYSGWVEVVSEGEKVLEGNIQEFLTWSAKEFALPKPGGRYTFTIENDNALVDGKPGLNRTVINCDASLSDREAPTLTMLNFRNSSDEITDRFTDASDCTLEFSAADLGSQRNDFGNGWYSVASPASVKVEYAAEGSDDFRELEVNEVPELYFEPGFGSFYRVPFKNAGMRSSTGWFQLRITVTDEAGNSQQQTIAPALYIESLAGVEDISYSSRLIREGNQFMGDGKIRIYDLTGRIVRTGEFSISTDGLSGAYIVSCNGEIVKIII